MCDHCDWEQALTDIRLMQQSALHILDLAKLDRLERRIRQTKHVTPMQKREIADLGAFQNGQED